MKKIILWIVGMVALVSLIAGATVFYNHYMEENKPSNVVVVGGKDESTQGETQEKETGAESSSASESETTLESETESPYLAPDFTFYDLEGNAVNLSDFRGKPIVLNFWSSGCGPCRNEMPHFEEAYKKYGDEVVFLIVNCIGFFGDTVESAHAYIEGEGYTFPVYYDVDNDAVGVYIGNSIPYTFFIDRNFDLYTYIPGMTDAATLDQCINMILD